MNGSNPDSNQRQVVKKKKRVSNLTKKLTEKFTRKNTQEGLASSYLSGNDEKMPSSAGGDTSICQAKKAEDHELPIARKF